MLTYLELSVALGVLQHVEQELGALLGPAALSPAELLGLKTKQTAVKQTSFFFTLMSSSTHAAQVNRLVSSLIQRCPKRVITAAVFPLFNPLLPAHLSTPAHAAVVATEGDTLVLDDDVPQVLVSFADVHALNGLGCLTGVLVRKTSVHEQLQHKQ